MRPDAPDFVEVAFMDGQRLVVLRVTRDVVALCRRRGWMVWDDLVAAAQAV
jgi:hypothetical protein